MIRRIRSADKFNGVLMEDSIGQYCLFFLFEDFATLPFEEGNLNEKLAGWDVPLR